MIFNGTAVGGVLTKYHLSQEQKESIEHNKWLTVRERKIFEMFYRDGVRIEDIAAEFELDRRTIGRELEKLRSKAEPPLGFCECPINVP